LDSNEFVQVEMPKFAIYFKCWGRGRLSDAMSERGRIERGDDGDLGREVNEAIVSKWRFRFSVYGPYLVS